MSHLLYVHQAVEDRFFFFGDTIVVATRFVQHKRKIGIEENLI